MSEKTFNGVRIINKHDVETNWLKAINFTPRQGELIVYDKDENYDYQRIKIGDGTTNVNDLPFYAGSWDDLDNKPFSSKEINIEQETSISASADLDVIWTYYPDTYNGLLNIDNTNNLSAQDLINATVLSGSSHIPDAIILESDIDENGNIIIVEQSRLFVFVAPGNTATWTNSSGNNYTFTEGIWLPCWNYLNGNLGVSAGIYKQEINYLDSKYLNSDIARVQSAESALELLIEMDVVDPTADENGAVYTDENNIIYVL